MDRKWKIDGGDLRVSFGRWMTSIMGGHNFERKIRSSDRDSRFLLL